MAHCSELTGRGVQDPLTGAHKPKGLIPKAGDTSHAPLSAPEPVPPHWLWLSQTSWECLGRAKVLIQPCQRGTVQLITPGLCLLETPD